MGVRAFWRLTGSSVLSKAVRRALKEGKRRWPSLTCRGLRWKLSRNDAAKWLTATWIVDFESGFLFLPRSLPDNDHAEFLSRRRKARRMSSFSGSDIQWRNGSLRPIAWQNPVYRRQVRSCFSWEGSCFESTTIRWFAAQALRKRIFLPAMDKS